MFVQYFTVLIGSLKNQANHLHRCISINSHKWIIDYFEFKELSKDHSTTDTELLLATLAMQLHSGMTYLFYVLLELMETEWDLQNLAVDLQLKVNTFDQHMSYGM